MNPDSRSNRYDLGNLELEVELVDELALLPCLSCLINHEGEFFELATVIVGENEHLSFAWLGARHLKLSHIYELESVHYLALLKSIRVNVRELTCLFECDGEQGVYIVWLAVSHNYENLPRYELSNLTDCGIGL